MNKDKAEVPTAEGQVAPLLSSASASRNIIEDSYIIVFKDDIDASAIMNHQVWVETVHNENINLLRTRNIQHPLLNEEEADHGLKHTFSIGESVRGYSGKFLPDTVEAIRHHDAVAFVERDTMVYASELEVEKDAPWGLARVSHREPLSLGTFNKYLYEEDAGEGVTAYVVDTGTNIEHVDFEGRAKWGATIPTGDFDQDDNGHGTHCSGTIAGKKYGIAKKANVVAVKVLRSNGSGSMSDVVILEGRVWVRLQPVPGTGHG
jgi:cerevisin